MLGRRGFQQSHARVFIDIDCPDRTDVNLRARTAVGFQPFTDTQPAGRSDLLTANPRGTVESLHLPPLLCELVRQIVLRGFFPKTPQTEARYDNQRRCDCDCHPRSPRSSSHIDPWLFTQTRCNSRPQRLRRLELRQLRRKLNPLLDLFKLAATLRTRNDVLRKLPRRFRRQLTVTVS